MENLDELTVFAASAGNYNLVKERVEAGANLNYVHPEKGSALYAGICSPQVIAYLLSAGADPNIVMNFNGSTALDHALSMIHYHTGQPAAILRKYGAKAVQWKIGDPPNSSPYLNCNLFLNARAWYRIVASGQVVFGQVFQNKGNWRVIMEGDPSDKEGYLFRIEAMHFQDKTSIHWMEYNESYEVTFCDFRGNRHAWSGEDIDEIEVNATIEFL